MTEREELDFRTRLRARGGFQEDTAASGGGGASVNPEVMFG